MHHMIGYLPSSYHRERVQKEHEKGDERLTGLTNEAAGNGGSPTNTTARKVPALLISPLRRLVTPDLYLDFKTTQNLDQNFKEEQYHEHLQD